MKISDTLLKYSGDCSYLKNSKEYLKQYHTWFVENLLTTVQFILNKSNIYLTDFQAENQTRKFTRLNIRDGAGKRLSKICTFVQSIKQIINNNKQKKNKNKKVNVHRQATKHITTTTSKFSPTIQSIIGNQTYQVNISSVCKNKSFKYLVNITVYI